MPFGLGRKPSQHEAELDVGPSYTETRTRSRRIMVAGAILAVCAGAASFILIQRAQEGAAVSSVGRVSVVVAARTIAAKTPIAPEDLVVREIPLDQAFAQGTFNSTDAIVGRLSGVPILPGQMITSNLFTFSAGSAALAIFGPAESFGPDSPEWRAVAISVPDDRAVGGILVAGEKVDVFLTALIAVPPTIVSGGQFYGDKATKVAYQDITILSKSGPMYVIRVTEQVAEEIVHMQATSGAQFSMALRADVDDRPVDLAQLGATMNMIIQRYGLPIPQVYPQVGQTIPVGPAPGTPLPLPSAVALGAPSPAPSP
jgi:Flp pilus assembly protein CpaB